MNQGKRIVQLLTEAERAVLESIASNDDGSVSPDYAALSVRLELARRISAIKEDAKKVYAVDAVKRGKERVETLSKNNNLIHFGDFSSTLENSSKRAEKEIAQRTSEQFGLPAYFVEAERLYMFGASTKGPFRMYRRTIPMNDVTVVIDTILGILAHTRFFSISEVEDEIKDMPGYKIRTTVSALQECAVLRTIGSGRYGVTPSSRLSKKDWLTALAELPKRPDLINEFAKS